MKILLLSCHSILEADWVKLWTDLGHYVFSPGSYVEPQNPGDESMRPKCVLPEKYADLYRDDLAAFHALGKPGIDNKELLTPEFVNRFDVVCLMHLPKWAHANKEVFKNKPVVWCTIGQSISGNEAEMKPYRERGNLKIVRYSPKERAIPGYIGEDCVIRFPKDPNEFKGWNGNNQQLISCAQSMLQRDFACNFTFFEKMSRPFQRKLYGPGNEAAGNWATGKVSFDELKAAFRDNRAYFCGGTHPASYVLNFIETWMTGIPVLTVGPELGDAKYFPGHRLQEYTALIENGVNGLASDSVEEHQAFVKILMDDRTLAKKIGEAGRAKAIELFGIDTIKKQWADFFNTI